MSKKRVVLSGVERAAVVVVEEEEEKQGKWESLNPDILALVFVRIPAEEMVRSVPLVCKPWMETVAGPYCWRDIDVGAWCRRRNQTHAVDLAVRNLVGRSNCTFFRLSAYRLGNPGFSFVANCGRCLKVLQIPRSEITDDMVIKLVESISNLTVLDISHCSKITGKGLEAFGKHCKSLVDLKRNMYPPENWEMLVESALRKIDDTEAKVIADTMINLQCLELCFGRFGDAGLSEILSKCRSLSHLDIQGSWNVQLNDDLKESCKKLKYFQSPCFHEYGNEVCMSILEKLYVERSKQRMEPVVALLDVIHLYLQCEINLRRLALCFGDGGPFEMLSKRKSVTLLSKLQSKSYLKERYRRLGYFQSPCFGEYCDEVCRSGLMKQIDEMIIKDVDMVESELKKRLELTHQCIKELDKMESQCKKMDVIESVWKKMLEQTHRFSKELDKMVSECKKMDVIESEWKKMLELILPNDDRKCESSSVEDESIEQRMDGVTKQMDRFIKQKDVIVSTCKKILELIHPNDDRKC